MQAVVELEPLPRAAMAVFMSLYCPVVGAVLTTRHPLGGVVRAVLLLNGLAFAVARANSPAIIVGKCMVTLCARQRSGIRGDFVVRWGTSELPMVFEEWTGINYIIVSSSLDHGEMHAMFDTVAFVRYFGMGYP